MAFWYGQYFENSIRYKEIDFSVFLMGWVTKSIGEVNYVYFYF